MSETEPPKITATVREKNPKRVEQGKRLAAISKAGKERKRLDREGAMRECEGEGLNYNYIALVGLVVGAVGVYYTYRTYHDNRSEAPAQREETHVEIKPAAKRLQLSTR